MNPSEPVQALCIACGSGMSPYIPAISDDRYGCPGVFSIARCTRCGQMATLPALKESELPGLYSRYYPRREVDVVALEAEARKVRAPAAKWRRWLAGTDNQGHYGAHPGERVLDIGSGSCLALLELRAMGVEAWGVEADPNVRALADRFGLNVHIGSIHDHPFPDLTFDRVVLNQVIEHVPDPQALLQEVKQRLKPGGTLVLSFPNTGSRQAARSGVRWINWHVPYHQHHFTRESFERLASQMGFTIGSVRTITPNLWTLLQIRANREAPAEGQVSPNWSSAPQPAVSSPGFTTRLKRALLSRAARAVAALSTVSNRIVDASGKGDSLLVELHVREGQ